MNTKNDGYNRVTGSVPVNNGENVGWLSDAPTNQSKTQRPSEGMISNVSGIGSESLSTSMLASAASPGSIPGIFRPPVTINDTSRLLSPGSSQYPSLYSTGSSASSNLSPYSSLQGGHSPSAIQGSHLQSHYNTYYPQYPYSQRSLLSGHYPQIESYSAVLQSMGSHVQQATHTQIPRNTYGHVSQYSVLGGSHQRSMSASVSPSPDTHHSPHTQNTNQGDMTLAHRERKLQEEHEIMSRLKDERAHSLSSIELSGGKSVSFKDPPRRDSISHRDPSYKVPSGKEGSLKHRILTRPSDSAIQSSLVDSRYSTYSGHHDEPALKRSKLDVKHSTEEVASSHVMMSSQKQESEQASQIRYPPHFMKGSIIQLSNGELKRVEDLQTEDFVQSAEISSDLKIDSSTVVKIEMNADHNTAILGFVVGEHKVQVTVEATLEHPFFVFGRGWSSCEPERSLHRYRLECQKLTVGDVCISLTHKDVRERAAEISLQQKQEQEGSEVKAVKSCSSPANRQSSPSEINSSQKHPGHQRGSPKDTVEVKQEDPYSIT